MLARSDLFASLVGFIKNHFFRSGLMFAVGKYYFRSIDTAMCYALETRQLNFRMGLRNTGVLVVRDKYTYVVFCLVTDEVFDQ